MYNGYYVFTFVPIYSLNINKPHYYFTTSQTRIPLPVTRSCYAVKDTTPEFHRHKERGIQKNIAHGDNMTFCMDVPAFPYETNLETWQEYIKYM